MKNQRWTIKVGSRLLNWISYWYCVYSISQCLTSKVAIGRMTCNYDSFFMYRHSSIVIVFIHSEGWVTYTTIVSSICRFIQPMHSKCYCMCRCSHCWDVVVSLQFWQMGQTDKKYYTKLYSESYTEMYLDTKFFLCRTPTPNDGSRLLFVIRHPSLNLLSSGVPFFSAAGSPIIITTIYNILIIISRKM